MKVLKEMLEELELELKMIELKINLNKPKIIKRRDDKIQMKGTEIEQTDEYVYLRPKKRNHN